MKVLNKTFTSEEYHMNCDLQMDKKIDIDMVWKICEDLFPDTKVVDLAFFDDDGNTIAQFENWKSKDYNLFKAECLEANIGLKDPLYWEVTIETDTLYITVGYDEDDCNSLYLYSDGTKDELEGIINTMGRLDRHIEVVK